MKKRINEGKYQEERMLELAQGNLFLKAEIKAKEKTVAHLIRKVIGYKRRL